MSTRSTVAFFVKQNSQKLSFFKNFLKTDRFVEHRYFLKNTYWHQKPLKSAPGKKRYNFFASTPQNLKLVPFESWEWGLSNGIIFRILVVDAKKLWALFADHNLNFLEKLYHFLAKICVFPKKSRFSKTNRRFSKTTLSLPKNATVVGGALRSATVRDRGVTGVTRPAGHFLGQHSK